MPMTKRSSDPEGGEPGEDTATPGGSGGSRPASATSPATRRSRDNSLRTLRSGTKLPEAGISDPWATPAAPELGRRLSSSNRSRPHSGRSSGSGGGKASSNPADSAKAHTQEPHAQPSPSTAEPPAAAQQAPRALPSILAAEHPVGASSLLEHQSSGLREDAPGQTAGVSDLDAAAELPKVVSVFSDPGAAGQADGLQEPEGGPLGTPQQADSAEVQIDPGSASQRAAEASSRQAGLAASGRREGEAGAGSFVAPKPYKRISPGPSEAAVDEEQQAAEKWEAEEQILAQARRIRRRRDVKIRQPFPEPKREKTHWDFLLEEMQWMAKEFSRERKWKLAQAKKICRKAAASEKNLILREAARQREESLQIRRKASWIGKEVMKFWAKAERVVNYKARTVADARKKEIMDKHLTFLVGQTQRYSSMLAERLKAGEEATPDELQAEQQLLKGVEAAAGAAEQTAELQEAIAAAATATAGRATAASGHGKPDAEEAGAREADEQLAAPVVGGESATDPELDDEDDFDAGMEVDEADDEATLEEEEKMAEDEDDDTANEIQELADEADVPIEQLLARYGYFPGAEAVHKPNEAGAAGAISPAGAAGTEIGSAEPEAASPAAAALERSGVEELMEEELDTTGDQEYEGSEEEVDDETTLEQEEMLAAHDGSNQKAEQDAELAALNAEAEMPIEELLAAYKRMQEGEPSDSEEEAQEAPHQWLESPAAPPSAADDNKSWAVLLSGSHGQSGGLSPSMAAAATSAPKIEVISETAARPAETRGKGGSTEDLAEAPRDAGKENLEGAAAIAAEVQPTGTTFETTNVRTKNPFLLKHTMREYQHIGLDWLVTIYERRLNGILADEMGLGKTIQTIALIAHLACEKGIWGPHLIVVPTSVMLNWEVEFKKWCPAFKLLTYFGSAKERKLKRQGWSKPNTFHVCITSYTLVLQDAKMFRRKKWKYLILDEAHMIKNWKSQRWQTLLNFNSARRLLITGTPLQNDLMELWSLMHFLMPQVFASHAQFKDWFHNPLTGMVEGSETINKGIVERLHSVLRPFLLRRLKSEVEKQMPPKHEHVVRCRLGKRQRTLYEDYMASSETRTMLSSGNFLGIVNVLMSLRKVCNHPDLFEGRPIISAFDAPGIELQLPSSAFTAAQRDIWKSISFSSFGLLPAELEGMSRWEAAAVKALSPPKRLIEELPAPPPALGLQDLPFEGQDLAEALPPTVSATAVAIAKQMAQSVAARLWNEAGARVALNAAINEQRCSRTPVFGEDILQAVRVERPSSSVCSTASMPHRYFDYCNSLRGAVLLPEQRSEQLDELLQAFVFAIPKARAPAPKAWCCHPDASVLAENRLRADVGAREFLARSGFMRTPAIRQQLFFPDRRLVQYDCGKLQELAKLLHNLKSGGHKALIFTQMTKMLDVLEVFLNLHGFIYLRLDGSTKPEQRQILMQRFNSNPKIFIFILSTRSGGVGMNLTGADTVIFYDSDWNPAMDAQAQDRCHRIGQTREVHIYRLVSEKTIEENILTKSDQKRHLDHLAIQSGGFNTDFLHKFNPSDLLRGVQGATSMKMSAEEIRAAVRSVEDENDAAAATAAEQETAAELAEFTAEPVPAREHDEEEEETGERDLPRDVVETKPAAVDETAQEPDEGGDLSSLLERDVKGRETAADTLLALESALRPVEKYAVLWLEQSAEKRIDVEAETAKVELELGAQEWNMQEIERRQRLQEEEAEEEGEAQRIAEWDRGAADAAYKAQVERAQQRQKVLEERALQQQKLLEERLAKEASQLQYLAPEAPGSNFASSSKRSRQRAWSAELDEDEASPKKGWFRRPVVTKRGRNVTRPNRHGSDDDVDPSSEEDFPLRPTSKRSRTNPRQRSVLGRNWAGQILANGASAPKLLSSKSTSQIWTPWEQAEDLVLCAVVAWSYPPQPLAQPPIPSADPQGQQPQSEPPRHDAQLQASSMPPGAGISLQEAADQKRPLPSAAEHAGLHSLPASSAALQPSVLPRTNGGSPLRPQQPANFQAILGGPGGASLQISPELWQRASNALAAGASALSPSAAASIFQQGRKRTAAACKARYEMLLNAARGAGGNSNAAALGLPLLQSKLIELVANNATLKAQELEKLLSMAAAAVEGNASSQNGVMPIVRAVLEEFRRLEHGHPAATSAAAALAAPGEPRASPLEASQLLEVIKRACGQAARELLQNLQSLLATLASGDVKAAHAQHLKQLLEGGLNGGQGGTPSFPVSLPRANLRPVPGAGRPAAGNPNHQPAASAYGWPGLIRPQISQQAASTSQMRPPTGHFPMQRSLTSGGQQIRSFPLQQQPVQDPQQLPGSGAPFLGFAQQPTVNPAASQMMLPPGLWPMAFPQHASVLSASFPHQLAGAPASLGVSSQPALAPRAGTSAPNAALQSWFQAQMALPPSAGPPPAPSDLAAAQSYGSMPQMSLLPQYPAAANGSGAQLPGQGVPGSAQFLFPSQQHLFGGVAAQQQAGFSTAQMRPSADSANKKAD